MNIRNWLDKIPQDKLLHFIAGGIITAVFALIKPIAPFACVFGILAGIVKELYDEKNGGVCDVWDFIATSIGAIALQVGVWIIILLW